MIELRDFSIGFGHSKLLEHVNLSFGNKLTALIGRNGSGKSTLLRAIAGLNKQYEGSILIGGKDIRDYSLTEMARTVAFVATERIRVPNLRCYDIVALGRAPYTNRFGSLHEKDREAIDMALSLTKMGNMAERQIDSLSDGERQRVMIARALAQSTPIILLDEPTSFLDLPSRYELCELLSHLTKKENKTIIFSTHELELAKQFGDEIAVVSNRNVISDKPSLLQQSGLIDKEFKIPT